MKLTLQNEDTVFSRKLLEELFRIEQYVNTVSYTHLDVYKRQVVYYVYINDASTVSAFKMTFNH